MQHRYEDLAVIADVLREQKPPVTIELGTDEGGFSSFLSDTVAEWGGDVVTFDIQRKFADRLLSEHRYLTFVEADVLAEPHALVLRAIGQPRAVLYCDNGNKMREIELYASYVGPHGLLATHDYVTEVDPAVIEPYLSKLGYVQHYHDRFAALAHPEWYPNNLTRFWRRERVPVSSFSMWLTNEITRLVAEQATAAVTTAVLDLVLYRPIDDVPEEVQGIVRQIRGHAE